MKDSEEDRSSSAESTSQQDTEVASATNINRRTCLKAVGAAAASLAVVTGSDSLTGQASAASGYGYGGVPLVTELDSVASVSTVAESEPNDHKQDANAIGLDTTVTGTLTSGEIDWFSFEVSSGKDLFVQYDREDADGVSAMVLFGPTGQLKNQVYASSDTAITLPATTDADGTHYVQIVDIRGGTGDYSVLATTGSEPTPGPTQSPYEGNVATIPGRIQAEDFDVGGEGVSYHDQDEENKGGEYRDTSVDIENSRDSDDGYNVGFIRDGEWLEYTTNVTPGTYNISFRVATKNEGRQIDVSLGDKHLGTLTLPTTGGWYTWQTETLTDVSIDADGEQVLRLDAVGTGFNLNWVEFSAVEKETETPTPTPTPTETETATESDDEDDYGELGFGEGGYGGDA